MDDVVIIGAGLSGLVTGFHAKKKGLSVTILEQSDRSGGVIRSERQEGFLLEFGPNTVQIKPELYELIESLNLQSEMMLASARSPRYILFQKKLRSVPMSPTSLFTSSLLSFRGKLRLLKEPFVPGNGHKGEESLFAFSQRRLGREVATRVVSPFVSGIWAGDAQTLSAKSTFPVLTGWEKDFGSVLKGAIVSRKTKSSNKYKELPKGLLTFQEGLETVTRRLAEFLKPEISMRETVQNLFQSGSEWTLQTRHQKINARNIVFATPPHQTAQMINSIFPVAAEALRSIPVASLAVLHLGFNKDQIGRFIPGFGYLAEAGEDSDILGCLWNSNLFSNRAPDRTVLCTVFMGGSTNPDVLALSDETLRTRATDALRPIMQISGVPIFSRITRHENAIPQYTLGHEERIRILEETEVKNPGLLFGGSYRGGISVSDVVRSATTTASKIKPT